MAGIIDRHPLQRLESPHLGMSALVHVIGLASFTASFKYLFDNPTLANEGYGWHFVYLTILGLFLATLTCLAGLLADMTQSPQLFRAKNILSMCSAPMEVLISVLYWGLSAIDKKLVLPDWALLPLYADVGFHFMPSFILIIDLLFLSPPWTISILPAMGLSVSIAFGYWFWIEHCYSYNGWYPYPIFDLLNTPQRIGLFLLSALIMAVVTVILKWTYGRVNGVVGVELPPKARSGTIK